MGFGSAIWLFMCWIPGGIIIVVALVKSQRRKKFYSEMMHRFQHYYTSAVPVKVRYCSQKRYEKLLKLFPWEAAGIMFLMPEQIQVHLTGAKKKHLHFQYSPLDYGIEWAGRDFWRNGPVSWVLLVSRSGDKHYFTSETGAFVFGSKGSTVSLRQKLEETLPLVRCSSCGYLLWGNVSSICTECGNSFKLAAASLEQPE